MKIAIKITIGVYSDDKLKETFIEWPEKKLVEFLHKSKARTMVGKFRELKAELEKECLLK